MPTSSPILVLVIRPSGWTRISFRQYRYLVNHPTEPYIVINDLSKIVNLKRLFPDLYRDDPVLTNGPCAI